MKAILSYDSKGQQCPCVNLIICDLRFHVWCFIHVGNTLLSYHPLTFPVLTGKEMTHFPYCHNPPKFTQFNNYFKAFYLNSLTIQMQNL